MAELPVEPLTRQFVTGESLPYLGRNVEMIVEDGVDFFDPSQPPPR